MTPEGVEFLETGCPKLNREPDAYNAVAIIASVTFAMLDLVVM